jgi:hypothetical protein
MAARDKVTGLTSMQEQFCIEYVRSADGNSSAAYRRAYNARNMKVASIQKESNKLRWKPRIAARIVELRANAVREAELSIERVLEEIRDSAFVDPIVLFGADGELRAMEDIPEHARRAIASFVVQGDGKVRVKLCDKLQALEKLLRFLGAFEKDNAQRIHSLLDDLPRTALKELEACLIELAREDQAADADAAEGGDRKY